MVPNVLYVMLFNSEFPYYTCHQKYLALKCKVEGGLCDLVLLGGNILYFISKVCCETVGNCIKNKSRKYIS